MSTPPIKPCKNSKLPTPFSLRLTFEERAALEQSAGNRPLGAYIRSKLFGGTEAPRKRRSRTRKPLKDEKALGELLGKLGESRLASNVNQLAKAANSGSLQVRALVQNSPFSPLVSVRHQMSTCRLRCLKRLLSGYDDPANYLPQDNRELLDRNFPPVTIFRG